MLVHTCAYVHVGPAVISNRLHLANSPLSLPLGSAAYWQLIGSSIVGAYMRAIVSVFGAVAQICDSSLQA